MNLLVIVAILILLAGLLAALKAKAPEHGSLSFDSKESLFSQAERSFLGVLEQALDSNYRVFGKVRLGDLVKPAKGLSKSRRATALNKVNQKHVDFVVCAATDLALVGIVELDDQSHQREDRAGRDVFVDLALSAAGIPIARFAAKRGYQIQEVRDVLVQTLNLSVKIPAPTQPTTQRGKRRDAGNLCNLSSF
jgi:very-short-patch-repair endonuclease